jgi:hypothetical protein
MDKESVYSEVSKKGKGGRGSNWCKKKNESECTNPNITYGFCEWDTDENRCRKNKDKIAEYESELKQTRERMEDPEETPLELELEEEEEVPERPFQKPEFMRELEMKSGDFATKAEIKDFRREFEKRGVNGPAIQGEFLRRMGSMAPPPDTPDDKRKRKEALDAYDRRIAVYLPASASDQELAESEAFYGRATSAERRPVYLFHSAEEKEALAKEEIEHFKSEQEREKGPTGRLSERQKKYRARRAAEAAAADKKRAEAGKRLETLEEIKERMKKGEFRKRGLVEVSGGAKKRRKTMRKGKSKGKKLKRKKGRKTKRTKRTRNKKGGSVPIVPTQDLVPGGTKQYGYDKPRQSNDKPSERSEPLVPTQALLPGGTKQYP